MKLITLFITLLTLNMCSSPKHVNKNKTDKSAICTVENVGTPKVMWTFYKTTAKQPLVNTFNKIIFEQPKATFSIDSLYQNSRLIIDTKAIFSGTEKNDVLSEYLFGKMMESNTVTMQITSFDTTKKQAQVKIHMNNTTVSKRAEIVIKEHTITLKGSFDLKQDFNAGEALYFYHTAVFDKHKGADGKSKTWADVTFEITFNTKLNCK